MSYPQYVVLTLLIIILGFIYSRTFKWRRTVNTRKKEKQKIWMYEEIVYSCGSSLGVFQLLIQITIHIFPSYRSDRILESEIGIVFATIFVVVFVVLGYVLTVEIPKNAKKYIAKAHPEYNII